VKAVNFTIPLQYLSYCDLQYHYCTVLVCKSKLLALQLYHSKQYLVISTYNAVYITQDQ